MSGSRSASSVDGSTLWVALFTAASALTTAALACATPFASLGSLAGTHLRRGHGVALMLLAWGVSQVVGFGLLHYPHDPKTIAWGAVLGIAALTALLGAHAATAQLDPRATIARLVLGYCASFVAFKLAVLAGALLLGGVATTLAPALMLHQFVRDGLILIGLELFHQALRRAGVPAPAKRKVRTA